jgi:hypothetical protein
MLLTTDHKPACPKHLSSRLLSNIVTYLQTARCHPGKRWFQLVSSNNGYENGRKAVGNCVYYITEQYFPYLDTSNIDFNNAQISHNK